MRPGAFDDFRARHQYAVFFSLTAAFVVLLRVFLHGASWPEGVFEGVFGAGGGTLASLWWARRSAAQGTQ